MMGQVPLISFTKWLDRKVTGGSQFGNVVFWVTFCILGQPLCIILYYFEFLGATDALSMPV